MVVGSLGFRALESRFKWCNCAGSVRSLAQGQDETHQKQYSVSISEDAQSKTVYVEVMNERIVRFSEPTS